MDKQSRPPIPRPLRRIVLVESGHRCAIPTCRFPTTELAHIRPWAEVKEHAFENLIALCPNCHTRYDGGEIDRQAMLAYKRNLALLTSRYSDFERRVLEHFVHNRTSQSIRLPAGYEPLLGYLVRDGVLSKPMIDSRFGSISTGGVAIAGFEVYTLLDGGRDLVERYYHAQIIDDDEPADTQEPEMSPSRLCPCSSGLPFDRCHGIA